MRIHQFGSAPSVVLSLCALGAMLVFMFTSTPTFASPTIEGADMTLVTTRSVAATPLTLPDNRAYELVSALDDAEIYPPEYKQIAETSLSGEYEGLPGKYRAAANGNAVAFMGDPPASGVTGSGTTGRGAGNQYLGTRAGRGWEAEDLEPANTNEGASSFQAFSDDLSLLTVYTTFPLTAEPSRPEACTNGTLYSHNTSGFHSLITGNQTRDKCFASGDAGFSANDSHTLLYSSSAYTPQAKQGAEFIDKNLYDSVDGVLHQVNVLPSGEPQQHPNATFGGKLHAEGGGEEEVNFLGDISADGSRVFWTDLNTEVTPEDPAGTTRLFVRENDTQQQSPLSPQGECTVASDACTVQIDAKQGGPGLSGGGQFRMATGDGSKVFFTDASQLTPGSSAVAGQADLYEYDVNTGLLSDLTAAKAGVHANVQGVIGASKDGSYVYFIADGALTQGRNAEGKEPTFEQPNLYLSHGAITTFIATLESKDNRFPSNSMAGSSGFSGDWRGSPGERAAEVAPGGGAVAFMSHLPLTGYDNKGLPEVFVYEAGASRISCASCNPSGAPPVPSTEGWENEFNSYVATSGSPSFMPRWIDEAGTQVYFMSNQQLVPQDTNHYDDVYEWESNGSGSCRRDTGCVTPLSSVTAPGAAFFIDASVNGENVFFTQRASLVPKAVNDTVKLYDVRVGGGFSETALACTGTGCQGVPPAPPIFATPSSVTFSGVGNFEAPPPPKSVVSKRKTASQIRAGKLAKALRMCRHKSPKSLTVCEKQARRKYAPAKKRGKR